MGPVLGSQVRAMKGSTTKKWDMVQTSICQRLIWGCLQELEVLVELGAQVLGWPCWGDTSRCCFNNLEPADWPLPVS